MKLKRTVQGLFPVRIDNEFPGIRLALWLFFPFTLLTLWRSQHHLFAVDGGAQSIATIPLNTYPEGAADTVIGIFALWGLSQLVIGLIYLVAAIRYRSLIPMLYMLAAVEYLIRMTYIPASKQIETAGTAPGAAGNIWFFLFACLMLILSLWQNNTPVSGI